MNIKQILTDYTELQELAVDKAKLKIMLTEDIDFTKKSNELWVNEIDTDDETIGVYLKNDCSDSYLVTLTIKDLEMNHSDWRNHCLNIRAEKEDKKKYVKTLLENQQKERDLKELERLTKLYK